MADNESDRSPLSSENSESNDKECKHDADTSISEGENKSDSFSKDEDSPNKDGSSGKEEDGDNKGAYTAGTRGFPPSRFTPRGPVFGGSSHFGGNPFAVKSNVTKNDAHEGSSLWPGLTPSKLGGGVSSPSRPVLRPPQLSSPATPATGQTNPPTATNTPSRSSFPLNPSRLGTPFSKSTPNEEVQEKSEVPTEDVSTSSTSAAVPASNNSCQNTPKFVPLGTPSNASNSQDSSSGSTRTSVTSFVFGQNLHERVVESPPNHVSQTPSTSKQTENGTDEPSSSTPTTNGTSSEMLFSAGLKKEQAQDTSNDSGGETPAKSLSEAAREYEESRAVKRKYEAVAVMTGEEDETNVLQISCKLYAYDTSAGSWAERGRGQLRLNDKVGTGGSTTLQSRVIMRTQGSLRVMLNTKVWAGMVVDRANAKSVRLTAMDNDQIKVFLVQATVKEADNLYTALERRVASQQRVSASSDDAPNSPEAGREAAVEEARSGLEASSFPNTEPSSKKGRSSLSSDQEDGGQDVGL